MYVLSFPRTQRTGFCGDYFLQEMAYRFRSSMHSGIACYDKLLLWGKLSVFSTALRRRLGVQTQLHSYVSISIRTRVQLAVYFRGLKNRWGRRNDAKPLRSRHKMTARLHVSNFAITRKFSNRFYFRFTVGCWNYTKIKPVRKFSRIR